MGRRKIYKENQKMCESTGNEKIAHLSEDGGMNTIINAQDSIIFAALKLIEELYKNDKISRQDFSDILIEYADRVDTGKFLVEIQSPDELLKEVPLCTI